MADRQTDKQTIRQSDNNAGRYTQIHTDTVRHIQTDRLADRDRQMQTDTDIHIYRYIHVQTYT